MSSGQMCKFGFLVTLAVAGPVSAQFDSNATELEPMVVTPKINPLDANMERLRKMLDEPGCQGCGPLIKASRESVYDKTYYGVGAVLSFLSGMPEKPFNISPEDRVEGRIAGDWRQYERDPDR